MGAYFKIAYAVFLVLIVLVVTFNVFGKITFGYGIGDLFYLVFIIGSSGILSFFFLVNRFSSFRVAVLVVMISLVIFTVLKLSIYRGREYSWNGNFFLE